MMGGVDFQKSIFDLRNHIQHLEGQLDYQENELKSCIIEKRRLRLDFVKQKNEKNNQIDNLISILWKRDDEIKHLETQLTERENELASCIKEKMVLKVDSRKLHNQKNNEIDHLTEILAEKDREIKKLNDILIVHEFNSSEKYESWEGDFNNGSGYRSA